MSAAVTLLVCACATASIVFPAQASANDMTCLQSPQRTKACPHLLYRLMRLPDQSSASVRCICVTDFQPFLQYPKSEVHLIRLRMDRRQLEAELNMELEPILQVLRREN